MNKGHVYKMVDGIFGILTHSPTTQVLCRVIDVDTVEEACTLLSKDFSGHFLPLTSEDDHKWAKQVLAGRQGGSVLVLTDPYAR